MLVQNKIPIGIVTGAQKARIISTVPREFLDKFNTLVTGDIVTKGKPFPEPYLFGLVGLSLLVGLVASYLSTYQFLRIYK